MQLQIHLFGIAKDIVGNSVMEIEVNKDSSIAEIKQCIVDIFPQFTDLRSFAIAKNNEYARDNERIASSDELALIPPVSGG